MQKLFPGFLILVAIAIVSCSNPETSPTDPPTSTSPAVPKEPQATAEPASSSTHLFGSWKVEKVIDLNTGEEKPEGFVPPDFAVTFNADGRYENFDGNTANNGTYEFDGKQISLDAGRQIMLVTQLTPNVLVWQFQAGDQTWEFQMVPQKDTQPGS